MSCSLGCELPKVWAAKGGELSLLCPPDFPFHWLNHQQDQHTGVWVMPSTQIQSTGLLLLLRTLEHYSITWNFSISCPHFGTRPCIQCLSNYPIWMLHLSFTSYLTLLTAENGWMGKWVLVSLFGPLPVPHMEAKSTSVTIFNLRKNLKASCKLTKGSQ